MPVPIPQGHSEKQASLMIGEEFLNRGKDPRLVNPVWMSWREDALKRINDLQLAIGKVITSSHVGVSTKHIGQIILKKIPSFDILLLVDYTEVKELYGYALRAWEQHSKEEYLNLCAKSRQIQVTQTGVKTAGVDYGM